MNLRKIIVNSQSQKYPIFIGQNIISKLSSIIKKNSIKFNNCLLVVDKNVPKKMTLLIKKNLKNKKIFIHYIKANEVNKNQKMSDQQDQSRRPRFDLRSSIIIPNKIKPIKSGKI